MLGLLQATLLLSMPVGIDYTRDVRPILADRCFACHGPDDKTRKAGLRLDDRDAALKALRSGSRAIVPGSPAKSELVARLRSDDPTTIMPPPKFNKPLTPREIGILESWVKQGAPYQKHWAWVKPSLPTVPEVRSRADSRNPIDRFILARLEKENLGSSPPADAAALLRRVTLDLTGLPPTLEEADRFLADTRNDAYERLVDRLLASPAFGERWAAPWLDLARYADSQGFANDPDRSIWPWRDWVIRSLNANLPYNQFTVEQLAGDLLPTPTNDQLIATGFHRNTLTNTEGGTSAEEFRSAAIVDRVNTTFQVWLGTTMACAQCHNHKYDPYSQKEYFQVYAIFNNSEDANSANDAPTLTLTVPGKEALRTQTLAMLEAKKAALAAESKRLEADLPAWDKSPPKGKLSPEVTRALKVPANKRDAKQQQLLLAHARAHSATYTALDKEVKQLESRLRSITATTPILREIKPRPTHIQLRGNYLDKGDLVTPGLPALLADPTMSGKVDRLALARWIASENNPLTARVAVNRLWEELFGLGLVETSEEFGTQGDQPTHPELLDWLALEFTRSGWDTKALLRLLVTSATYRQSSRVNPELVARDPSNRLLSRGPRVRLTAEAVRDQALFVSGLLSRKLFGPPVQPARPSFGLSAAFGSGTDWTTSTGEDSHRRALYTRWRRNAPYPSATTFDAPERTACSVRRIRTNTPLQALVTLNDPVYMEASQALARRVLQEAGPTPQERARHAFRLCLTRVPTSEEVNRLVSLFEATRTRYSGQPAQALALARGEPIKGTSAADLAAWVVVGNVLLNLDETIHKR